MTSIFTIVILIYALVLVRTDKICRKYMYDTVLRNEAWNMDVFAIWYPGRAGTRSIRQLCSNSNGMPIERHCTHNSTTSNVTWDALYDKVELIECSIIADQCREEPFQHYFVMKNNVAKSNINTWPAAKLGELAKSIEPCLLETGLPLTRKCLYNPKHYAAEWEAKDFRSTKCLRAINQTVVTYELNQLYQDTKANSGRMDAEENLRVAQELTDILDNQEAMRIAADLEIATNILQLITSTDKDPAMLPKVLQATNLLMQTDDGVVFSSYDLDTPTTLIRTVDTYLDGMTNILMPTTNKCKDVNDDVYYRLENLTSVFYINPACSNISGIAVYSASVQPSPSMIYDQPSNTYFRFLYLNQSLDEIMNETDIEAAAYFAESVWENLLNDTAGKSEMQPIKISLYNNTNFFMDQENDRRAVNSAVLKLSLPNYTGELPGDVSLIFRNHHMDRQKTTQCGHYETNKWITNPKSTRNDHNMVLCQTSQLTSFAALIGLGSRRHIPGDALKLTIKWELALDIVSIVGCGLSLFGLICIWVTAVCCKEWRSQSSNKLLLNMCFVLTLIMVYFLFINMPDIRNALVDINNHCQCIAEGAFLQYTILVLFLWMLFLAIMQYQRYVTVIGVERPRHFIAKYALAAWALPLIPTALVISLDSASYMPYTESDTICYPSGLSMYLAVLLPISIVTLANIAISIYILFSVGRSLNKFAETHNRRKIVVQIRLSILLFFVLGVAWLFGILAHTTNNVVFSFIFCLTSTLQGFMLFIYFVVLNQSIRYSWFKYFCDKEYNTMDEVQSTNAS